MHWRQQRGLGAGGRSDRKHTHATPRRPSFAPQVALRGGRVRRIPPYAASKFSPLDNGAFGLSLRFMEHNAATLINMPMMDALDYTLRRCCSDGAARYCFYNCGYFSTTYKR